MKRKLRTLLILLFAALALLVVITGRVMAQMEGQVFFIYIISVIVLIAAAFSITTWVEKSVLGPAAKIKEAIERMENGDPDYILDVDSDDELGEIGQEFDKLRIKLNSEKERREQVTKENLELIANISHDLKTPITAIKGYSEGILDGVVNTPEQQLRYVQTIYNKADDMAKLIDELTYYTKIDTNRIPYSFAKVSPVEFFYDCIEEVGTDMESQHIEFTDKCQVDSKDIVIADVEQLKKVVYNIINNAVKYIDKTPGRIEIRLLDDGDFVKFEIEDNGKGIAQADIPNVFDRFYRTDASRNSMTGGSGIGLAISKKIIEDHGGRIWASSKEGVGTTFTFILRKYQEAAEDE